MTGEILRGRVILMTGAGRWPGPALALAFARAGATVAANDLSPALLDPLAEAAETLPGEIRSYVADATRGMPLRAMLDEILDDFGQISVLVNNPRIMPETPLLEMDEWDWQRTIEVNLNGPYLITRLVAGQMKEAGGGAILNLVDTAAQALESAGRSAYAASQAGFLSFSQAATRELMTYNIRVYTLCPEYEVLYPTDPTEFTLLAADAALHSSEALTRLAVFLSSTAAENQAGQIFRVNRRQHFPWPEHQQEQG